MTKKTAKTFFLQPHWDKRYNNDKLRNMELNEFIQLFPSEEECYDYLNHIIKEKNVSCMNCGSHGLVWRKDSKHWVCPTCGHATTLEELFSQIKKLFPDDRIPDLSDNLCTQECQPNHSSTDLDYFPMQEDECIVDDSNEGEFLRSSSSECDLHIPDNSAVGNIGGSLIGSTSIPGAIAIPRGLIGMSIWGKWLARMFRKGHSAFSSIFAPAEIARGDDMTVQVFVYKDGERNHVIMEALAADDSASERKYVPLNFRLKKGDKVDVVLNIIGAQVDRNVRSFVWQGKYTSCAFFVHVPKEYQRNKLFGEVFLTVNGATLGELQFITKIVTHPDTKGTASVVSRPIKKVFISYAHEDAKTVCQQVKAYEPLDITYFLDDQTLRSGDVYNEKIFEHIRSSDLFILYWSSNAASSDYVKKEYRYAMSLAYPQVKPEEATIAICPMSIEPHAEYPEDLKGIYHFRKI